MLRNKCFSYSKIFMIESISSIWRGKSLIINFVMNRILQVIYIPKSIPRYLLICRHNSCSEMLECFVLEEEENLLYTYCAYEPSDVSVVLLRISLTLARNFWPDIGRLETFNQTFTGPCFVSLHWTYKSF